MEITFFFLCHIWRCLLKRNREICFLVLLILTADLDLNQYVISFSREAMRVFALGMSTGSRQQLGSWVSSRGSPMSICSRNSEAEKQMPKVAGKASAVCHGSGWSATLTSFRLDEQGIIMTVYQPVSCQTYWHGEDKELWEFQIIGRDETQLSIVCILCKQQPILSLKNMAVYQIYWC